MNIKCVSTIAAMFLLATVSVSAQTISPKANSTGTGADTAQVYTFVEQMPEFPGGVTKMQEFLLQQIVYPDSARIKGIEGKTMVRFVVDKEGAIQNPEVVRSVDADLDAEALRVVRSMPRWIPGKQNGRNVDVLFILPVSFTLE